MSKPTASEVARKHMNELENEPNLSLIVRKAITMRRMLDAGYHDTEIMNAISGVAK